MIEFLRAGGPIMVPLLGCSVLALAIVVERLINLRESKTLPVDEVEHLESLISAGLLEQAGEYCDRRPGPLNNIVGAALEARDEPKEEMRQIVEDQGRQEVPRLERYLGVLGTVVSISPLLGLLGTVTGMINVFQVVSSQGVGQANQLAGGISEALITTATGLGIAIPSLVAYNHLTGRAQSMVLEMERLALKMMRTIVEQRGRRGGGPGEGAAGASQEERQPVPVESERV